MSDIMLLSNPNINLKHIQSLYAIYDKMVAESLWQGYRQKQFKCNDVVVSNADEFANYYMGLMENHNWQTGKFIVKLNYRDMWGTIYKTDEWIFSP